MKNQIHIPNMYYSNILFYKTYHIILVLQNNICNSIQVRMFCKRVKRDIFTFSKKKKNLKLKMSEKISLKKMIRKVKRILSENPILTCNTFRFKSHPMDPQMLNCFSHLCTHTMPYSKKLNEIYVRKQWFWEQYRQIFM